MNKLFNDSMFILALKKRKEKDWDFLLKVLKTSSVRVPRKSQWCHLLLPAANKSILLELQHHTILLIETQLLPFFGTEQPLQILRSKLCVFSTLSSCSIYATVTLWMERLILCHACLKQFFHQSGHLHRSVPLFTQFCACLP